MFQSTWVCGPSSGGRSRLQMVILGGTDVPQVNEAVSCVVRRGQGWRLGHMGLLPAQGQAQVGGQRLPSGWPVAWGQGLGTSTWARGGRWSDLSSTEVGAK